LGNLDQVRETFLPKVILSKVGGWENQASCRACPLSSINQEVTCLLELNVQRELLSTLVNIQGALPMQKASTTLLVIMVISSLSLWGVSHQKNGATNTKIRELENRHAKLEEDYRVILAANEANRRKITQLDLQRTELIAKIDDLQVIVKERDDLKAQLTTRTEERDDAQTQLMQFSKDLQNLASRVGAAASRSHGSTLNAIPASRNSE
jgi:hypothetical protein